MSLIALMYKGGIQNDRSHLKREKAHPLRGPEKSESPRDLGFP